MKLKSCQISEIILQITEFVDFFRIVTSWHILNAAESWITCQQNWPRVSSVML